ncbi:uncharacterized protein LOC118206055 isoform X2 [Stegodyphus dumicola]|uniref:uncharacterized protein LOC118206055 isoform X2 n=1 Tax=Stegodyphus dumicola TaxID=202533 RepID=UPI0015ACFCF0|nr:uncharacterized protein LOC118206055 isoform X2 [Stegodyphus dumicola]
MSDRCLSPVLQPGYHEYISPTSFHMSWYEEHKGDIFDFQTEILAYCRSDGDICRCCLEFRDQILDVAGVDSFRYVTIASACMATYRSGHIQPNTIAIVPTHGYVNSTNYSPDSIRCLDFVAASKGIAIQHALNSFAEHRIAGISVEGFCEETQTVYQFQGCFFHGCSSSYDGDVIHPLMEKLGRDVLYHDTDSIIYATNGRNDPPLGNFLEEFTNELLDGDVIKTFMSGGPKNYAYQTATGKACCKVRGFSLNFRNSQLLKILKL